MAKRLKTFILLSALFIACSSYAIEEGNAVFTHGSTEIFPYEESPIHLEITSGKYEGCFVIGTVHPDHGRGYLKDAQISCIFEKNQHFNRQMKNIIINDLDKGGGIPMVHKEVSESTLKLLKSACQNNLDEIACKAYIASPFGKYEVQQYTPITMYWENVEN